MSLRDVAISFFALGRLEMRDQVLLPRLLRRAAYEADLFHAIEMVQVAAGLADLGIAPASVLRNLSDAAIKKIDQFGPAEAPSFLSALASLSWHEPRLLRAVALQLPNLAPSMSPRQLCETANALSSSRQWLPPALQLLGDETAAKATVFSAAQATAMLAAFATLRWDQPAASKALAAQLLAQAPELGLSEASVALHALSRLPLACEPPTLRAVLRAAAHADLPPLGSAPRPQTLSLLALLCNALRHHRTPPPPRLLRYLRSLDGIGAGAGGARPVSERRHWAKIADALRAWSGHSERPDIR